ncbi:acyltransferase [Caulobacter sp. S45]|uniref:acyltransferase family protein n=1 Tax=Caulobacter sp. S45 TaxID=1641861 RepID=UPI0015759EEF|nr:acyltransferase [Caulobacter sp. S45]
MKEKLASIQYLRAIAALLVVFHHARNVHPWLYNPLADFGLAQCGVDVFFVISGFVMYSAARSETTGEFLRRRLIRIVPPYWLATIVSAPLILLNHASALNGPLVAHVADSLLFIPHYSPEHAGEIWPLLAVGWSLNYEMFFYIVFAAGIAARRLVGVAVVTLGLLVVAGLLLKSDNALWRSYTDPLLFEFLAGVGLAVGRERLRSHDLSLLLPIGFVALGLSTMMKLPQVLAWGVPALMIVAGAISLETRGRLPRLKALGMLGDASYAIYLFQVICIGLVGLAVQRLPIHGPLQLVLMIAACMVSSAVAGLAIHYGLERPLLRYLSGRRFPPAQREFTPRAAPSVG